MSRTHRIETSNQQLPQRVLVTGGAGYIGSHPCVLLLEAGLEVTVIDNLSNGSIAALRRVEEITGRRLRFIEGDVRSWNDLVPALEGRVDVVIHFAAHKAVGESCVMPLIYFDNRHHHTDAGNAGEVSNTWCSLLPQRYTVRRTRCRCRRMLLSISPTRMATPSW